MTADDVAEALELRLSAWIPEHDLLHAIPLERSVLTAVMSGDIARKSLKLESKHFVVSWHRYLWEALEESTEFPEVAKLLMARGCEGVGLWLADFARDSWVPPHAPQDLRKQADEIRRVWWSRIWNTELRKLAGLVASGGITKQADLLERIRVVARETGK